MPYITICRGLGIILVVLGHCQPDYFTFYPIYSFHMPLFFFLAGIVFKEDHSNHLLNYILKRIKRLIIPYLGFNLFFGLITYFCQRCFLMWKAYDPISIHSLIIGPLTTGTNSVLFDMSWFLYTLFIVQTFFCIFLRVGKNTKKIHMLLILFVLFLIITVVSKYYNLGSNSFTLQFGRFIAGLFFYGLGFYVGKQKEFNNIWGCPS